MVWLGERQAAVPFSKLLMMRSSMGAAHVPSLPYSDMPSKKRKMRM